MKTLRLIIVSMILAMFMAVSAIAQTSTGTKIALIDTQSFYASKGGITKILKAYERLQTEFKPAFAKYQAKTTEFNTLKKSYDSLVASRSKGVPVKDSDILAKRDQLTVLQTEIKRMQEDLKKQQEKREGEILRPIIAEIGKSIRSYAKDKGYTLVMDVGRMSNAQIVLHFDEKTDITKAFITFYNAKPAGTASK